MSPQRHSRPSAAATLTWPSSPAAPRWPRTSRPPATMPSPSPVEALRTSTSSCSRRWPSRSEAAITLQSLSRTSGALVTSGGMAPSGTPSQPAMAGESTLTTRTGSTVPASESPTPRTSSPERPRSASMPAQVVGDDRHEHVGPEPDLLVVAGRRQLGAVQGAHRHLGAAAPDRHREHQTGVAIEDQRRGRPATGRRLLVALEDEAGRGEGRQPGAHRGAGQAGDAAELAPGGGAARPDQVEELARRRTWERGPGWSRGQTCCPAFKHQITFAEKNQCLVVRVLNHPYGGVP